MAIIAEVPGTKYGDWTVLDEKPVQDKYRSYKWKCRCVCGTERFVSGSALRGGRSSGCGCTAGDKRAERSRIDLAGQRFGRLVVLRVAKRRGNWTSAYWHVRCDCGNEKIVEGKALRNGLTQSCGCLRDERVGKAATKPAKATIVTKIASSYRAGARKRDLEFKLTKRDVERLIFGTCFYCGSEPANIFTPKRFKNPDVHPDPVLYNGIDRVDNTIGYTVTNCVTCCHICNGAKRDQTKEDFLAWIRRTYEYQEDWYNTSRQDR